MKSSLQNSSRLAAYLTAGVGAGCVGSNSDAATVITFYGPGAKSTGTTPATPAGIDIGSTLGNGGLYTTDAILASAGFGNGVYFTDGTTNITSTSFGYGTYSYNGVANNGAVWDSDQNYANISFDPSGTNDGVYEAVAQFYLNGTGGGYLVALAVNDNGSALSITQGKTAIDAVPEASSLALLALGAGGLIARRKRSAA